MKVTRVLHVSINVEGRLGENEDFYGALLCLTSQRRPEIPGVDGRWYAADGVQVHLVDAPSGDHGINPTGPHFCLAVADLAEALDELDQRNIPWFRAMQSAPGGPDVAQVWFTDPSGNTIELQQETTVASYD